MVVDEWSSRIHVQCSGRDSIICAIIMAQEASEEHAYTMKAERRTGWPHDDKQTRHEFHVSLKNQSSEVNFFCAFQKWDGGLSPSHTTRGWPNTPIYLSLTFWVGSCTYGIGPNSAQSACLTSHSTSWAVISAHLSSESPCQCSAELAPLPLLSWGVGTPYRLLLVNFLQS